MLHFRACASSRVIGLNPLTFKGCDISSSMMSVFDFFSLLEMRITCTSSATFPLNLAGIWIIPFLILVRNSIVSMLHLYSDYTTRGQRVSFSIPHSANFSVNIHLRDLML